MSRELALSYNFLRTCFSYYSTLNVYNSLKNIDRNIIVSVSLLLYIALSYNMLHEVIRFLKKFGLATLLSLSYLMIVTESVTESDIAQYTELCMYHIIW